MKKELAKLAAKYEKGGRVDEFNKAKEQLSSGEIKESPRGPVAKFIGDDVSDALKQAREMMSAEMPVFGDTVGDFILGQTPEALKDWSYDRRSMARMGSTDQGLAGAVQGIKLDPRIVDVLGAASTPFDVLGVGKLATKGGRKLLNKASEAIQKANKLRATDRTDTLEALTEKYGDAPQGYSGGGAVTKGRKAFFSMIDKAIEGLKQPKGTGEQMLKMIESTPGVKKEELQVRGVPEALKGKKSVTKEEIKASIKPPVNIERIEKSRKAPEGWDSEVQNQLNVLKDYDIHPVVDPEDPSNLVFELRTPGGTQQFTAGELRARPADELGVTKDQKDLINRSLMDVGGEFYSAASANAPKFAKYQVPGGKNYREILLTLPGQTEDEIADQALSKVGLKIQKDGPNRWATDAEGNPVHIEGSSIIRPGSRVATPEEAAAIEVARNVKAPEGYTSGHWQEKNPLLHVRVSDRVDDQGKKVLYVDEIQSDWHQSGRDKGYATPEQMKRKDELESNLRRILNEGPTYEEIEAFYQPGKIVETPWGFDKVLRFNPQSPASGGVSKAEWEKAYSTNFNELMAEAEMESLRTGRQIHVGDIARLAKQETDDTMGAINPAKWWSVEVQEVDAQGNPKRGTKPRVHATSPADSMRMEINKELRPLYDAVPDAPFKKNWHELAVKQILDEAAGGDYDRVVFGPGKEQIDRYKQTLRQTVDNITYEMGTREDSKQALKVIGYKDGQNVFGAWVDPETQKIIGGPANDKTVREVFGEGVASKVNADLPDMLSSMDTAPRTIEGDDLSVGGRFMYKFYDEIVPQYAKQYAGKEFGAPTGPVDIPIGGKNVPEEEIRRLMDEISESETDEFMARTQDLAHQEADAQVRAYFGDDVDAMDQDEFDQHVWNTMDDIIPDAQGRALRQMAEEKLGANQPQTVRGFGVDITPEMREKIRSQGQRMFSAGAGGVGAEQAYEQTQEEQPQQYAGGGKVVSLITKPLRSFASDLGERVAARAEEMANKVAAHEGWKFDLGDRVKSPKTGKVYEITGKSWDNRNDRPMYKYESAGVGPDDEGYEAGMFIADKAEETLEPMTGPKKAYAKGGEVGDEDYFDPGYDKYMTASDKVLEAIRRVQVSGGLETGRDRYTDTVGYGGRVGYGQPVGDNGYLSAGVSGAGHRAKVKDAGTFANSQVVGGDISYSTPKHSISARYDRQYSPAPQAGPYSAADAVMRNSPFRSMDQMPVPEKNRIGIEYRYNFAGGGLVKAGEKILEAVDKLRVMHGGPSKVSRQEGKVMDVTTEPRYATKRGADKMMGKSGPPALTQFDIPKERLIRHEVQYTPEELELMRRYMTKIPADRPTSGAELWDLAQGNDTIMTGMTQAGGFAGYQRPASGSANRGEWYRIVDQKELEPVEKRRGGLAQVK